MPVLHCPAEVMHIAFQFVFVFVSTDCQLKKTTFWHPGLADMRPKDTHTHKQQTCDK